MKKLYLLLVLSFVSVHLSYGQKETNMWCFGTSCGVDFNSGSPVNFSGVQLNQLEGVSSICDASGALLFYTDGVRVWNKNHVQMPNGSGLLGNSSTTQSALIVKQPGNPNMYYIFTPEVSYGSSGLNYSTVDMTLQSGLGDVVQKNINLLSTCDERVCGLRHANGTDVWIVTTANSTDDIVSFLLTASGVNTTPVTSTATTKHFGSVDNLGYIKASVQGNRLGIALHTDSFELYDYDNNTGIASNQIIMQSGNYSWAYGVEFSPDGTRFYGSEYGSGDHIYQFDLTAGSATAIINSATLVGVSAGQYAVALQLAPDGKIYMARLYNTYLGVINSPNTLGMGCNYVDNGFLLGSGATCQAGLPNYVSDLFQTTPKPPVANFNTALTSICQNACIAYSNLSQNATTYQWTFAGGTPATSTSSAPTVCYTQTGTYDVELIATNSQGSDTLLMTNYITVNVLPVSGSVTAVPDTICSGSAAQLSVSGSVGSLQWQESPNGSSFTDIGAATAPSYTTVALNQSTFYRVKATNSCGTDTSVSAVITVVPNPAAGIISATRDSMCEGTGQTSTLTLAGSNGNLGWESSTDGINFTPMGLSATSYTTPPGLAQTTYYRVIAAGGSTCPPDTSAPLTIHIQPFPLAFYTETVNSMVVVFSSVGSSSDVISYNWSFGDGGTSSLANPTHTFSKSDTFEVCLSVFNGSNCSYTLCKDVIILGTGIEELAGEKQINLYPNPANDQLNVAVSGLYGEWQLKVYTVLGQELMQQPVTLSGQETIPVSIASFAQGSYYLVLTNGDKYYSNKFVHLK